MTSHVWHHHWEIWSSKAKHSPIFGNLTERNFWKKIQRSYFGLKTLFSKNKLTKFLDFWLFSGFFFQKMRSVRFPDFGFFFQDLPIEVKGTLRCCDFRKYRKIEKIKTLKKLRKIEKLKFFLNFKIFLKIATSQKKIKKL